MAEATTWNMHLCSERLSGQVIAVHASDQSNNLPWSLPFAHLQLLRLFDLTAAAQPINLLHCALPIPAPFEGAGIPAPFF